MSFHEKCGLEALDFLSRFIAGQKPTTEEQGLVQWLEKEGLLDRQGPLMALRVTSLGHHVIKSRGTPEVKNGEQAKEPARLRLTVDFARKILTLDGVDYDVSSDNALRWVKVLADHPGEWISGADLGRKQYDDLLVGCRTDRLRRFLPKKISTLIDSKKGAGSRIRL